MGKYLVSVTMVEENRMPLVKIQVLESQGVIKSLTDWLLFLNFIVSLEECVAQETLELSISTEHPNFFRKTA